MTWLADGDGLGGHFSHPDSGGQDLNRGANEVQGRVGILIEKCMMLEDGEVGQLSP